MMEICKVTSVSSVSDKAYLERSKLVYPEFFDAKCSKADIGAFADICDPNNE